MQCCCGSEASAPGKKKKKDKIGKKTKDIKQLDETEYEWCELIGRGSFGEVKRVTRKSDAKEMACKIGNQIPIQISFDNYLSGHRILLQEDDKADITGNRIDATIIINK